jgi:hypothetical protein
MAERKERIRTERKILFILIFLIFTFHNAHKVSLLHSSASETDRRRTNRSLTSYTLNKFGRSTAFVSVGVTYRETSIIDHPYSKTTYLKNHIVTCLVGDLFY